MLQCVDVEVGGAVERSGQVANACEIGHPVRPGQLLVLNDKNLTVWIFDQNRIIKYQNLKVT